MEYAHYKNKRTQEELVGLEKGRRKGKKAGDIVNMNRLTYKYKR